MGEAPLVLAQAKILSEADGDCVAIERVHGKSPVLLICEHASRTLPEHFGDLGLSEEALSSHIAWDPGALAVARAISAALDATLIYQRFSRLIYDCNRPPSSPGAMPAASSWQRRFSASSFSGSSAARSSAMPAGISARRLCSPS